MKFIAYIAAILIIGGFFVKDIYAEKENKVDELGFKTTNPIELGYVDWHRNFNNAVEIAKKENKPLLVLFQEVPGCSTASGFGREVLTHPLIIEAVENEFIPVAIYNNKDGHDKEVLSSFNEPSWNNPVVRVITPERKELAPRLNGNYSKLGLVKTMKTALQNGGEEIPEYLEILEQELTAEKTKIDTAVFAMSCFWTGEGKIGSITGVLSTEPGFMGGREVVKIEYNPKIISFEELLKTAKKNNVASHVYASGKNQHEIAEKIVGKNTVSNLGSFSPDSEPKYYMSKTPYRFIPMTPLQASRVNSAIGFSISPDKLLSEKQIQLLNYVKANPDKNWKSQIENKDFTTAWNQVFSKIETKVTKN